MPLLRQNEGALIFFSKPSAVSSCLRKEWLLWQSRAACKDIQKVQHEANPWEAEMNSCAVAGRYLFLCMSTSKPWDISERHHPGASPQHPPHIVLPHSPQTSWESSKERAGGALQSCSHISPWRQSCERGSWLPTTGRIMRLHRAQAPPAADVGFYCSGLPCHWATCTAHLTHSSYSFSVCTGIILAGSSS